MSWNRECEALFEAGRSSEEEPSLEDRRRVAKRIAAQLAGASAIASVAAGASHAVPTVQTGAAATGGVVSATLTLPVAKVIALLALGFGAIMAVVAAVSIPPQKEHPLQVAPSATTQTTPVIASKATHVVAPLPPAPRPAPAPLTAPPALANPDAVSSAPSPSVAVAPSAPSSTRRATPSTASARSAVTAAPTSVSDGLGVATSPSEPAVQLQPSPHDTDGELRLVRAIDDALRRGDYAGALRALDAHDAAFGPGHFAQECAAARVLVGCGSGLTEAGRQSACAFFSRYPRSPMNERIQTSCSVRCE
jgi:hypothetical protein